MVIIIERFVKSLEIDGPILIIFTIIFPTEYPNPSHFNLSLHDYHDH